MKTFTRLYGESPLHLLSMMFCLVLTGAVVYVAGPEAFWNRDVWWQSIAVWFVGAALAHDLLLFPLYALADRSVVSGLRALRGRRPSRAPLVDPLNYVRVPFLVAGLTFLVFYPGIIEQGARDYENATGLTQDPFAARWLVFVAVVFGASALAYAAHTAVVGRRARTEQALEVQ